MMSLDEFSYVTIAGLKSTIIPTIFGVNKHPEVITSGDSWQHSNTRHVWGNEQPPESQDIDTCKLLNKVISFIKTWWFGVIVQAMTAGEGYRYVGCKRVIMLAYVATGMPRCDKYTF
ncbi:hypothetical protein DL764_006575 [Monosporascus ibericus]|uniref:Uncharacterized protein n=1 Tax=Monosporascus ibericus TaxID=155417 RepID=A0A4Q4T4E4_9PEZI|nr:hypothetical protein DL764_006575 [Monosporascus ibericus]